MTRDWEIVYKVVCPYSEIAATGIPGTSNLEYRINRWTSARKGIFVFTKLKDAARLRNLLIRRSSTSWLRWAIMRGLGKEVEQYGQTRCTFEIGNRVYVVANAEYTCAAFKPISMAEAKSR